MIQKNIETITLEPFTSIVSFSYIDYKTNISVSGSIGHYLFPDKETYKTKVKIFNASSVGRKNKQKISELVSEVYAYLNTNLVEYADPKNYSFRLWIRVTINKETGEILGHPNFDIDLYRHIGKIGGIHTSIEKYSLCVLYIGKERIPISSTFNSGIRKAVEQTKVIMFKKYASYFAAPKNIREKISKDSPYLIIDEKIYAIHPKIDPDTDEFFSCITDNGVVVEFRNEDDVAKFILKKVKIRPQIISSETGLDFVDKEIKKISSKLIETPTDSKVDLISSLGLEEIIGELSANLENVSSIELSKELERDRKKHSRVLEQINKQFTTIKGKYEVQLDELEELANDRNEKTITGDEYRSYRVKTQNAIKALRTELINIQQELKAKIVKEIDDFVTRTKKKEQKKNVSEK